MRKVLQDDRNFQISHPTPAGRRQTTLYATFSAHYHLARRILVLDGSCTTNSTNRLFAQLPTFRKIIDLTQKPHLPGQHDRAVAVHLACERAELWFEDVNSYLAEFSEQPAAEQEESES